MFTKAELKVFRIWNIL